MKGIIEPRGDGRWRLRVSLGEIDGKRRFLTETFQGSRRQAETRLAELVTAAGRRRGVYMDARTTVGEYLDDWLADRRGVDAPATIAIRERHLRLHIKPALGHLRLRDLRSQQLERFYRERQAAGYSARSVRGLHATLSAALADAVRHNLLPDAATDRARAPELPRDPPRAASAEVVQAALAGAPDRVAAAVIIMAAGGLRRGEVCPLRWDTDLDLEAGVVQVTRQLVVVDRQVLTTGPKSASSVRAVLLPAEAIAWLRGYRQRQREARMQAGCRPDEDWVFHDARGRPWKPSALTSAVRAAGAAAGVHLYPHALRHYHVTQLLVGGVQPRVAQVRAGHASFATTMQTYSHVLKELEQRAADVAGASLGIILGSNRPKPG